MKNIFRNLRPYWKTMIIMIFFLAVQAYCDLSLPQYTQDIIDTGIQNKGVEHILPERINADEYHSAQIFMTKKEKNAWTDAYQKTGSRYERKEMTDERLNKLDDQLLTPLVLTYQMGHTSVKEFKKTIRQALASNPATRAEAGQIETMSIPQMERVLGQEIKTFRAEDENGTEKTYVDMRPMMQRMIRRGMMDQRQIRQAKKKMEKTVEKTGTQTLQSMGIAYAYQCDEAAGVNVDAKQKAYLWKEGGRMLVMALCMVLAAIVVAYLASKTGAKVGRDLRHRVFHHVVGFSNAEMDQFSTASLITRSTNDVQQIQLVTTMMLRIVLYSPVLGIWGIIKVVQTGAHMAWVIVLGILVIVGVMGLLVAIAMPKFKAMQRLVDAVNRVSREILTGLSVIRAFGREKTEEDRFDVANTDLKQTQLFTGRVMTFMMPGITLIMNGLVVLITWVSAHRINNGTMQVGAMTAFITYSMMIVMSFLLLSVMSIMLPRAGVAADRIQEVLDTKTAVQDPEHPVKPAAVHGEITFEAVCFRYPGAKKDAIHEIRFTARPGETTAIIGSTGSGKSTLVNLIPRFYDVSSGRICVDGVDVRDMSLHELRQAIGLVPQKGVLFSGTIAENIRFGKDDASDAEVLRAAKIAQADDFIAEKEDGYDSLVAQGGDNVSGGQKQRLAIARAIAKQPPVLVFDDSFSALDMKTDARLRKTLEREAGNATKIIVAQRISTILQADQILVLEEGRLVGKGTHAQLMKECSVYQQIASSQLSRAELEEIGS